MAVAMDNAILENILRQVRPLIGQGKVADYIPALATVDGSRLGIAICTVDGQLFQAGDAQERFSIQSISKVLSLVVAMRHYSEEEIWQRVGKDPSGYYRIRVSQNGKAHAQSHSSSRHQRRLAHRWHNNH